ncbi:MAG TPA: septum formation initiator family protein [bacterium]|nr:septum formation initiator family protein [bacterium]
MSPRRRLRPAATQAQVRARRRRLMTIGAAVALALAFTTLTNQYAKTYTLAREKARLEQRRRDLLTDNARLRDEIQRLQTDDRYVEQIARQQLGLVRPGEVELLVIPYEGMVSAPAAAPPGTAAERTSIGGADSAVRPAEGPVPRESTAPRPRRGFAVWATGVRDAVLRLLGVPHR